MLLMKKDRIILNNQISMMRKSKTDGVGILEPWVLRLLVSKLRQIFYYSVQDPLAFKLLKISFLVDVKKSVLSKLKTYSIKIQLDSSSLLKMMQEKIDFNLAYINFKNSITTSEFKVLTSQNKIYKSLKHMMS